MLVAALRAVLDGLLLGATPLHGVLHLGILRGALQQVVPTQVPSGAWSLQGPITWGTWGLEENTSGSRKILDGGSVNLRTLAGDNSSSSGQSRAAGTGPSAEPLAMKGEQCA